MSQIIRLRSAMGKKRRNETLKSLKMPYQNVIFCRKFLVPQSHDTHLAVKLFQRALIEAQNSLEIHFQNHIFKSWITLSGEGNTLEDIFINYLSNFEFGVFEFFPGPKMEYGMDLIDEQHFLNNFGPLLDEFNIPIPTWDSAESIEEFLKEIEEEEDKSKEADELDVPTNEYDEIQWIVDDGQKEEKEVAEELPWLNDDEEEKKNDGDDEQEESIFDEEEEETDDEDREVQRIFEGCGRKRKWERDDEDDDNCGGVVVKTCAGHTPIFFRGEKCRRCAKNMSPMEKMARLLEELVEEKDEDDEDDSDNDSVQYICENGVIVDVI